VDEQEWWGTRDIAAFLSVPAAIEFQEKHNWDKVRDECHTMARDALQKICEITGLPPLHPLEDGWFGQMVSAPLPSDTDIVTLKTKLYDEYCIEVPLIEWFPSPTLREGAGVRVGNKLIRVSIQGYNTKRDIDMLCHALSVILT
jgi:isopenicillin-N epimerase